MRVVCPLLLLLAGCSDPGTTLFVDLRTDLAASSEFDEYEIEVGSELVRGSATPDRPYLDGVRVAEFEGLPRGSLGVGVRLLNGGAIVVERPVIVRLEDPLAITVVITRNCRDVRCPAAGDDPLASACLAGRCVDPGCTEQTPELCGDPDCAGPLECAPAATCASALCAGGVCLYAPITGSCSAGQRCDPDLGCVSATPDCTWSPFEAPVSLGDSINGGNGDFYPSLSADGLTLYFNSARTGNGDIYTIGRASIDVSFTGPAIPLAEVNTSAYEGSPYLFDESTLFFDRGPTSFRDTDLLTFERAGAGGTFAAPAMDPVASLNTGLMDTSMSLTPDGLTLFFSSGGGADQDIYTARRDALGDVFGSVQPVAELNTAGAEGWPGLSRDGLTLVFSRSPDGALERHDLWLSTRDSLDAGFEMPRELTELNSPEADYTAELSPDGTTLFFSSTRDGDDDLYSAERTCL